MKKILFHFSTRLAALSLLSLMILSFVPESTNAAFPGSNGRLIYSTSDFDQDSGDFLASHIKVREPGSSEEITLTSSEAPNFYYSPRYSADGSKITFSSIPYDWMKHIGYTEGYKDSVAGGNVFIMNADGSNLQNISNLDISANPDKTGYSAMYSSFNTNGDKLAFSEVWKDEDDITQCRIFVANSDGSNKQQITVNDAVSTCALYPVFSPTQNKLAFTSQRYSEGSTQEEINEEYWVVAVDLDNFGPEGPAPFIESIGEDTGGNNPLESYWPGILAIALPNFMGEQAIPTTVDWSPDGSSILYTRIDYDQPEADVMTQNIVIKNFDNDTSEDVFSVESPNLKNSPGHMLIQPQFTPEGQITFRDFYNDFEGGEFSSTVYQINNDGSNKATLAELNSANPEAFSGCNFMGCETLTAYHSLVTPSTQPAFATNPIDPPAVPTDPSSPPLTIPATSTLANTGQSVKILLTLSSVLTLLGLGFASRSMIIEHHQKERI